MSTTDLVLCFDVGTTNVKAAVVDPTGHLLRIAHREMPIEKGDDGKAEHDPDKLFNAVVECLTEASTGYADRIALLIPATYQMGLIALDSSGSALTGMITLLDTRARQTHDDLLQKIPGVQLYDKTGCPPVFHYPLAKLYWLKTKRPDIYKQTVSIMSCKDYLLYRLANIKSADISVSSTTQYMNIHTLKWDLDILNAVKVNESLLPDPAVPEQIVQDELDNTRKLLQLPNLCGILIGAYDGGAVGIGLGGFEDGMAVMNFGTTAMLRHSRDNPALSIDGSMQIQSSFLARGKWIPGGAINNAGAVLRWLRDNVFNTDFETLTADAKAAADSAGLLFLPYLTGERSLSIGTDASGCYYGLRSVHSRGHMVRAAFEGVGYSLRRVKDSLAATGFSPSLIRVGSGGSHSRVWMEIVSSILDIPLQTTHAEEPGLLGSALLGYVALGHYPDTSAASRSMIRPDHTYRPDTLLKAKYDSGYERFNYLTEQMRILQDKFPTPLP